VNKQQRQRYGAAAFFFIAAGLFAFGITQIPKATPPGAPDTSQGVTLAAQHYLATMASGRYGSAWEGLTPADQAAIPQDKWTSYYTQCGEHLATYKVVAVAMASPEYAIAVAELSYTGHGMPPGTGPVQMPFYYLDDQWRYEAPLTIWQQGPVAAMLATARQAGIC